MVVKLSDRVEVEWFKQVSPISVTAEDEIAVSGIGTIAAARIIPRDAEPFIAVSMYGRWADLLSTRGLAAEALRSPVAHICVRVVMVFATLSRPVG